MAENDNKLLTIVVPVRNKASDFNNMRAWLSKIQKEQLPISVIVVHNGDDSDTRSHLFILSEEFSFELKNEFVPSPGYARNEGMKGVTTPWITFWDHDDEGFPSELIESIKNACDKTSTIIGRFKIVDDVTGVEKVSRQIQKGLRNFALTPGIWRIVFRTKRINGQIFGSERMGEDQLFLAKINLKEHEVEFSKSIFYAYHQGYLEQLTNSLNAKKDIVKIIQQMGKLLIETDVSPYVYVMYWRLILSEMKRRRFKNLLSFQGIKFVYDLSLRGKIKSFNSILYIGFRIFLKRQVM